MASVVVVAVIVLLVVFYSNPIYTFPLYYLLYFVEARVLQGRRQRVLFAVQIVFFSLYFITVFLRNAGRKDREFTDIWTRNAMVFCLLSQLVFSLIGYLNGFHILDILINNYKFIEVFVFYYVIATSAENTSDMRFLLQMIFIEAMCLGIYELFTTTRGGIGLLILMNFGAIFFCDGVINSKSFWQISTFISFLIVVFSQARSYMIAYFLSLFIVYLFTSQGSKIKAIGYILTFGFVLVVLIYINRSAPRVSTLLTRLAILREGLDQAGGYRLPEFQVAFSKFLENPLGRGLGYLEYTYIPKMGTFEWGDYMHIATGEILLKTGIIGTILYFYIILKTAFLGYLNILTAKQAKNKVLLAICIGGFAGYISRIVFFNMSSHNTYGTLFLPIIFANIYYDLYFNEANNHEVEVSGSKYIR